MSGHVADGDEDEEEEEEEEEGDDEGRDINTACISRSTAHLFRFQALKHLTQALDGARVAVSSAMQLRTR